MKILVMKFRNIGDVLLTSPLLANLRLNYPDAVIDFALNKGCEAVIDENPNIRKIHIYDREKAKNGSLVDRFLTELRYIKAIKKEKYDIAIQTTTGDRGIIIAKYAKIKKIISCQSKNKSVNKFITHKVERVQGPRHIVDQNLDLLSVLDLKIFTKKVEIFANKNLVDNLNLPNHFIHFHVTSRWMFKCVKSKIMADLIDFCEDTLGIRVVITADKNEAEMEKIKEVLSFVKSNPLNLAGKLSLKEVIALSKKSNLFIGVDTAIMHIAAANNIPVIAFFGPSAAYEWGPWDNDEFESSYTNKNGIQKMGNNIVFQDSLECVPCHKDGCNGTKISDCLMSFDIEPVKKAIIEKFGV